MILSTKIKFLTTQIKLQTQKNGNLALAKNISMAFLENLRCSFIFLRRFFRTFAPRKKTQAASEMPGAEYGISRFCKGVKQVLHAGFYLHTENAVCSLYDKLAEECALFA
mgnify:CR=1 FL=1